MWAAIPSTGTTSLMVLTCFNGSPLTSPRSALPLTQMNWWGELLMFLTTSASVFSHGSYPLGSWAHHALPQHFPSGSSTFTDGGLHRRCTQLDECNTTGTQTKCWSVGGLWKNPQQSLVSVNSALSVPVEQVGASYHQNVLRVDVVFNACVIKLRGMPVMPPASTKYTNCIGKGRN